jgi:hypothetical protein
VCQRDQRDSDTGRELPEAGFPYRHGPALAVWWRRIGADTGQGRALR